MNIRKQYKLMAKSVKNGILTMNKESVKYIL